MLERVLTFDVGYLLNNWWKKVSLTAKWAFFSALVSGTVGHIYFFMSRYMNEDDMISLNAGVWSVAHLGRWLSELYFRFRSYYKLPLVTGIVIILSLAFAAALGSSVLKVKSKYCAAAMGMLISTFPSICYAASYQGGADTLIAPLLLAVASIYACEIKKYGIFLGSIFLCFTFATYQSYVSATIALCLIYLLLELMNTNQPLLTTAKKAASFLCMGVGGLFLYICSIPVMTKLTGIPLTDYKGISSLGKFELSGVVQGVITCYKRVWDSFRGKYYAVDGFLLTMYILIAIATLLIFVNLLVKFKIYKTPGRLIALIATFLVLPIGVNILDVVAPTAGVYILNMHPFVYILIFSVALIDKQLDCDKSVKILASIGLITSFVIVLCYLVISNTHYLKSEMYNRRTFSLTNRIIAKIEPLLPLSNKVAVIGNIVKNPYYSNLRIGFESEQADDPGYGFGQFIGYGYPGEVGLWDNTNKLVSNLMNNHGISIQGASGEELQRLKVATVDMPIWPEEGSVAVVDGVITVHMGDLDFIDVEQSGNELKFTLITPDIESKTYAWYLIKNGEILEYIETGKENKIEYTVTEDGVYRATGFYEDDNKQGDVVYSYEIQIGSPD